MCVFPSLESFCDGGLSVPPTKIYIPRYTRLRASSLGGKFSSSSVHPVALLVLAFESAGLECIFAVLD